MGYLWGVTRSRGHHRGGLAVIALVMALCAVMGGAAIATAASGSSFGPVTSIPPEEAKQPVYLDLGDSVGMWNNNRSYPNILAGHYRQAIPGLELVNMACSGETTESMMHNSTCAPGGSQLANAVAFLGSHRGDVALVTMSIGGNDVVECVSAPDPANCFTTNLATMKANLGYILDALRQAAGPSVPIVGMNVFDPLLGDWLGPKGARSEAMLGVSTVSQLDQAMDETYTAALSPIVNVQAAFDSTDMTHFVNSKWGRVPIAVAKACSLIDIGCEKGASELFGDDPNLAGAVVIAHAFEKSIGHLRPPA